MHYDISWRKLISYVALALLCVLPQTALGQTTMPEVVNISITSLSLTEGKSGSYTVVLASEPTDPVEVVVSSDNSSVLLGTEMLGRITLTFTMDNWDTAQTVTVKAVQDDDAVDDMARLSHEVSGGSYVSVTALLPVDVTITDDGEPGVDISTTSLSLTEGESGSYTVVLTSEPTGPVEVVVSSNNPSVLLGLGNLERITLTFTMDNWDTSQTVTVKAVQDDDAADVMASLGHEVSGGDYGSVTAPDVTVTIADDGEPPIAVPNVELSTTSLSLTEGESGSYTVVLTSQPTGPVEVVVSPDNSSVLLGTEMLGRITLTFTMDNWDTAQTVEIEAADDADPGMAILSHRVSGGGYGLVTASNVTVTIADDGEPAIAVPNVELSTTSLSLTEGESGSYTVVLTSEPTGPVEVVVSSNNPSVLLGLGNLERITLTFNVADWDTAQTVTVKADQDDDAVDGTARLRHEVSGGGDDSDVTVTIADDDDSETSSGGGSGLLWFLLAAPALMARRRRLTAKVRLQQHSRLSAQLLINPRRLR